MVGNRFIHRIIRPALTAEPHCIAPRLMSRHDILIDTVAYNDYLFCFQPQSLHTQREDAWVWLADTHYRRFHNLAEKTIKPKLFQHHGNVAIEIADKHHRTTIMQDGKHLTATLRFFLRTLI